MTVTPSRTLNDPTCLRQLPSPQGGAGGLGGWWQALSSCLTLIHDFGTESASPFSAFWVSSRGRSGTLESVLRPSGRPALAGPVKSQVPARTLSSAAPAPWEPFFTWLQAACARGAPNNRDKPSPANRHVELRFFFFFFYLCGLSADHAGVPLVVQGTMLHPREVEETLAFLPFLRQPHLWTTSSPAQPPREPAESSRRPTGGDKL